MISIVVLQLVVLAICFYGLAKIRLNGITILSAAYVVLSAINISLSYLVLVNAGKLFYYLLITTFSVSILYPTYIVIAATINFIFIEDFWIVFFVCLGGLWVIIQLIREMHTHKNLFVYNNIHYHDMVNLFYIATAIPVASFVDIYRIDENFTLLGTYAVVKWIILLSILFIWTRSASIFISILILLWVSFYLLFYAYLGIYNDGADILIIFMLHTIYVLCFMMIFIRHAYMKNRCVKASQPIDQ